jgi:hypothetical protein
MDWFLAYYNTLFQLQSMTGETVHTKQAAASWAKSATNTFFICVKGKLVSDILFTSRILTRFNLNTLSDTVNKTGKRGTKQTTGLAAVSGNFVLLNNNVVYRPVSR